MGIFGVVLYTDRHPNIKKVLRDPDYWEALDEISGPVLQLFAIRTAQGRWDSGVPRGASGMLNGIWLEPQANLPLLKLFELNSTVGLPALVVFTWDSDEVVEKVVIPLADHDPVTSFSRLREVVEVASRAVGSADKDGVSGQDYIAMVRSGFAAFGRRDQIKKGYEFLKEIRDWLPF